MIQLEQCFEGLFEQPADVRQAVAFGCSGAVAVVRLKVKATYAASAERVMNRLFRDDDVIGVNLV